MPHYAIKAKGDKEAVGICFEETIEDVQAELVLGPGNWLVNEISEEEADKFAEEWVNGEVHPDYICPICEGHRVGSIRGDIVMQICLNCGFES